MNSQKIHIIFVQNDKHSNCTFFLHKMIWEYIYGPFTLKQNTHPMAWILSSLCLEPRPCDVGPYPCGACIMSPLCFNTFLSCLLYPRRSWTYLCCTYTLYLSWFMSFIHLPSWTHISNTSHLHVTIVSPPHSSKLTRHTCIIISCHFLSPTSTYHQQILALSLPER